MLRRSARGQDFRTMETMSIWNGFLSEREIEFLIKIVFSLAAGVLIGLERESRDKPAGISTQSLVIGGAMLFTMISIQADPTSPARIAAQIISGVGFLGAGIILKGEHGMVTNLTTAASIWFSAAIGMALGYSWYAVAVTAALFSALVPRIPSYGYGKGGRRAGENRRADD